MLTVLLRPAYNTPFQSQSDYQNVQFWSHLLFHPFRRTNIHEIKRAIKTLKIKL